MAAKKPTAPVKGKTNLPTNWEEELAASADEYAKQEESTAVGQFYGTKSGVLTWQDTPLKNNTLVCVIVDAIIENVYYEGKFDPDNPQPPTCFAFGRDDKTIKPHQIVFDANQQQNQQCEGCPQNEWGSSDVGKGKACKNSRRLALIPAGTIEQNGKVAVIDDPEHYTTAPVGYMRLPVTSVRGFAAYVKQLAGALRRPPHGVITKITLVPDAKTQFKILFEAVGNCPAEIMPEVMAKHKETRTMIEFPYSLEEREAPAPKKAPARKRKY